MLSTDFLNFNMSFGLFVKNIYVANAIFSANWLLISSQYVILYFIRKNEPPTIRSSDGLGLFKANRY